jgi:predicted ATPase
VQDSIEGLKRLIIEKTEGNPFFMEETVQVLLDEGALVRDGAAVRLTKSLGELKIPPTVQAILASRIDRLPPDEKELLQTLAVIGREFALSLVKRVFDGRKNDELERMLANLQMAEFIYEQAATGDTEYIFKHALTQQVAYNSLLIERRKLLHERAGEALELMFAGELDDHLGDLAHHYGHSDNVEKAVEYLGRAGQQALLRSAYVDAISSLSAAMDLLPRLSDSPERTQRELLLQMALGPALTVVKGYAAPETERAYIRARELCERLGDPPELFRALYGLWLVYLLRGELRTAYQLAEQFLRRAQSAHDPALPVYGHYALGDTWFWMGEFLLATEHFEMALSLYVPERHRSLVFLYGGIDPGVACGTYAAFAMWQLGYPDQALKRANEALALAQGLSHPFTLAFAEYYVSVLRQLRREARAAQEAAEGVIALSAERGLTDYLARAASLRGWAMAEQGLIEQGITQIQEGMSASHAIGTDLYRTYFLILLAEACIKTDSIDDGLNALTAALANANEHENRVSESEIHRLKGELQLKQNNSNIAEAQSALSAPLGLRASRAPNQWSCARR